MSDKDDARIEELEGALENVRSDLDSLQRDYDNVRSEKYEAEDKLDDIRDILNRR